jgi:hypothetical protein
VSPDPGSSRSWSLWVTRALQDLADVRSLLLQPGIDQAEVEGYFARAGLEEKLDEIRKTL